MILLLFVHGFLGSEHSFETFPLDLKLTLVENYNTRDVEARIFPRFDTKGDPTRAVNQLCNWLLLNANEAEYEGVIVLCHSMGGLMVVDAYRKLYGFLDGNKGKHVKKEKDEKTDEGKKATEKDDKDGKATGGPSWFGSLGSWWGHGPKNGAVDDEALKNLEDTVKAAELAEHSKDDALSQSKPETVGDALAIPPPLADAYPLNRIRPPVNIVGIVAFDAPFFGLHSRVYTSAAGSRAASVISTYVPPLPPMPSIPAPPIPIGSALQAIPQAVGAGVQASAQVVGAIPQVASDALRYSTRAVGSIPEAATGLVTALPGTVAALPGAATQGVHMGLQAVAALPGATFQLGSSALQSVAALPTLWSRSPSPGKKEEASGVEKGKDDVPETADSGMDDATPGEESQVTAQEAASEQEETSTDQSMNEDSLLLPQDTAMNTDAKSPEAPTDMQDETVIFAAAVAAAAAAVEQSQSAHSSPTEETPPSQLTDNTILLPCTTETRDSSTASASAVGLLPIPQDTNWAPWVRLGLAGAAVAAGAYYSGGLIYAGPVVRRVAVAYALSHAEEARKHLQFLYPLWGESAKGLSQRMEDIVGEVVDGRLGFRCFYVELPPIPVETPVETPARKGDPDASSTSAKKAVAAKTSAVRLKNRLAEVVVSKTQQNTQSETTAATIVVSPVDSAAGTQSEGDKGSDNESASSTTTVDAEPADSVDKPQPKRERSPVAVAFAAQLAASRPTPPPTESPGPVVGTPKSTTPPAPPRTFIHPPPQSYCHLFRPVRSDCADEIAGHMNMFSRELNAGPYWGLVDQVATEVVRCVKRVRNGKSVE